METNTELLNRIEAHIKGRLAVAESRAASSELYEGKKIAYNSILGFVNSLRADLAATTAEEIEGTPQEVTLTPSNEGAPVAFEHRILGRADISSCCD